MLTCWSTYDGGVYLIDGIIWLGDPLMVEFLTWFINCGVDSSSSSYNPNYDWVYYDINMYVLLWYEHVSYAMIRI